VSDEIDSAALLGGVSTAQMTEAIQRLCAILRAEAWTLGDPSERITWPDDPATPSEGA